MVTSTHLRLTRRVPTLKEMPKSRKMEAEIAYGGPLFGTIASLACGALYLATDLRLFLSLAYTGFFLNLFNLVPIRPLDGGRVAQIFSKRAWMLGGSMLGAPTSLCTPTNTGNRDMGVQMTATAANLKRWIANHEAVNDRVTEERRLLTPAASFRKALRVGVLHHQVSAPVPAASIEKALRVHRTWVRLRAVSIPRATNLARDLYSKSNTR